MDAITDALQVLKANAAAIITLLGGLVTGYLAFASKRSGDRVDGRKVDVDDRRIDIEERKLLADERARQQGLFDQFIARLEREREEARKENAELRQTVRDQTGHIQALGEQAVEQTRRITFLERKIDGMRAYIGQLADAMRADGKEPPQPPEAF